MRSAPRGARTVGAPIVLGALTAVLAACDDGDGRSMPTTSPSATTVLAATSTTGLGAPPVSAAVPSEPVTLTEPCPDSDRNGPTGVDQVAESARLEPDLGRVLAYGAEQAGEFGGYGLVWRGDDVSVFGAFTDRLDEHRATRTEMVEHPDDLLVCEAALNDAAGRTLMNQLVTELDGRFLGISGASRGRVGVDLRADEEALAGELSVRYGDAIDLRVGALAYPLDQAEPVCPPPTPTRSTPGLTITVDDATVPLPAGGGDSVGRSVTLTADPVPITLA